MKKIFCFFYRVAFAIAIVTVANSSAYSTDGLEENEVASRKKSDIISRLPRGLSILILGNYLTPAQLIPVKKTCQAWKLLANDNAVWHDLAQQMHHVYLGRAKPHYVTWEQVVIEHTLLVKATIAAIVDGGEESQQAILLRQQAAATVGSLIPYKSNPVVTQELEGDSLFKLPHESTLELQPSLDQSILENWEDNPDNTRAMIEEMFVLGDLPAFCAKCKGLDEGIYGYDRRPEEAKNLIDAEVLQGYTRGMVLKRIGLQEGKFGFPQNLAVYEEFEDQVIKDYCNTLNVPVYIRNEGSREFVVQETIKRKLLRICERIDRGETTLRELREFNEWLIAQGNLLAIHRKIVCLSRGTYAVSILKLIGAYIPESVEEYMQRDDYTLNELQEYERYKWCGYEHSCAVATDFINRLANSNHEFGIVRKLNGMRLGVEGYEQDQEAESTYLQELILQKNKIAIDRKREILKKQGDVNQIVSFEEWLVSRGYKPAILRKVLWLTLGKNEYLIDQDPEAAVELVKQHQIHFYTWSQ